MSYNHLKFPLRLSAQTFAFTWEFADGVDEMPTPLFVQLDGGTPEKIADIQARALVEITQLAGTGYEAMLNELEDAYQLLSRAPSEYYGWVVRSDGSAFSALVAAHRRTALIAVVDGDDVVLNSVEPFNAAAGLVSVLPDCAPAQFRSASARTSELFGNGSGVLRPAAQRAGADLGTLRTVFGTNPVGKGQLAVAVRGPNGNRVVNSKAANFIDPEPGRVLFYASDTGGGEYVTAMPGRADSIVQRLEEVHAKLL